jgi:hypothetical protein
MRLAELPTAEFCAPKTGLAADRQWNSAACLGLAEIGTPDNLFD